MHDSGLHRQGTHQKARKLSKMPFQPGLPFQQHIPSCSSVAYPPRSCPRGDWLLSMLWTCSGLDVSMCTWQGSTRKYLPGPASVPDKKVEGFSHSIQCFDSRLQQEEALQQAQDPHFAHMIRFSSTKDRDSENGTRYYAHSVLTTQSKLT